MSQSQNATNSTSAGAALQTQLGELTVLPQTSLPGLKGPISKGRDEEKDGRQGRGERRGGYSVLRRGEGREGKVSLPNVKNLTSHTATDPSATRTRSAQIAHLCSAAVSLNAHVHQLLPVLQNERTNERTQSADHISAVAVAPPIPEVLRCRTQTGCDVTRTCLSMPSSDASTLIVGGAQASYFWSEARERRWGPWRVGSHPLPTRQRIGECCNLPQRGPWQSSGP